MAANREKSSSDLYGVLGLNKECTPSELRSAYKKLALRWHPDRCSASGNSKFVEDAKKKFQAIQGAYSVLSDANKRFLYDVGVYDSDDDDENGMGDFLDEMATMMSQTESSGNGGEGSFEDLQDLFEEMFHGEVNAFGSSTSYYSTSTSSSSFSSETLNGNKRNLSEMNSTKASAETCFSSFNDHLQTFSIGENGISSGRCQQGGGRKRRTAATGRSSRHL